MKKTVVIAVIVALCIAAVPVFAQRGNDERISEFYYVKVSVDKIFLHRDGYVVEYRRGPHQVSRVYLPHEWFVEAAGRGELINLPRGNSWPTMSVYYQNGEFSHVRLYVHPVQSHRTWGVIPQNVNLDNYFENVESIHLEF